MRKRRNLGEAVLLRDEGADAATMRWPAKSILREIGRAYQVLVMGGAAGIALMFLDHGVALFGTVMPAWVIAACGGCATVAVAAAWRSGRWQFLRSTLMVQLWALVLLSVSQSALEFVQSGADRARFGHMTTVFEWCVAGLFLVAAIASLADLVAWERER